MKFKIKKYIYLINDVTNLILKKERVEAEESAKKLRVALIIIGALFLISLVLNIYYFL